MKDGGLRLIFRSRLKPFQWTSIETAGTASGVPDSEFITPEGVQGWIEFKRTKKFYVEIRDLQVAWLMRRCRMGGNAWIAVRRIPIAKRDEETDELWLMFGDQAESLFHHGLDGVHAMCWKGGESNWNWDQIKDILNHK